MSPNGLNLLTKWEGSREHMYRCSAGHPTIGVGHLLTKSENMSGKIRIAGRTLRWADGLSNKDILALLRQDLKKRVYCVNTNVKVLLTQNQFDCLVSFVFNIGRSAFKSSTLLKILNRKLYSDVPAQLKRWNKSGGKVDRGLINRRRKEIALWNISNK